jgi:hypothetical protein
MANREWFVILSRWMGRENNLRRSGGTLDLHTRCLGHG